jgi:peptidoglycan/LPS O-acetylase OafA/YrhL
LTGIHPSIRAMAQATPQISDWLIARFSRVTRSGEIIREVDGLRFIAISTVVFHHILANVVQSCYRVQIPPEGWQGLKQTHYLAWVLSPTWFGVQLFFVISGFVLALPFARHYLSGAMAPNLKSYYLRRLVRIEPPYFIALTLYMLLVILREPHWQAWLPNFFASLFYLHNLIYGQMSRIGIIFWSLEIEVQFYLVAPFLSQMFSIRSGIVRRGMLIGLLILWGYFLPRWVPIYSGRTSLTLVSNLQYFLAGFLLLDFYLAKGPLQARKSYRWDCVAPACVIALDIILLKYSNGSWLLPFVIMLLYTSLFLGRLGHRLLTHPLIYIIGGMCYTIYLYHALVIVYAGRELTFSLSSPEQPLLLNLCLQTLLLAPFIVIVCGVLFYFFEKPFMQLKVRA